MPRSRSPPALLGAALAALALAGCSEASGGDEAFGKRVRAYLLEHPEVLEEAIQRLDQKRAEASAADQVKALAANRQALERDARDPVFGQADAPVTVVEFFDYRCPYCKTVADDVVALASAGRDIRFVFKELPILPDANGRLGVSERAARLALAAHGQGKYLAVHSDLMAARPLDDVVLERIARKHGLDPAMARTASPAVGAHLEANQKLAEALGVSGTPAFVVGDVVIPGADLEALRAAIVQARKAPAEGRT